MTIDRQALAALRARVELEVACGVPDFVAAVPKLPPAPSKAAAFQRRPPAPAAPAAAPPSEETMPRGKRPTPPPPPAQQPAAAPPKRLPIAPLEGDKRARLAAIDAVVKECRRCPLGKERTQSVFARGNPDARIMFVGEGPGADEDRLGEPFVGRAGQLLDRIVEAMGIGRDDVYIANVVKCRPPGNRVPTFEEVQECFPYLREQIEIVRPEVMIALGATAARALLNTTASMGSLRGRFFEWQGVPLACTYHPAYLLRNPADKGKVWEDMKLVMKRLGMELPAKGAAPAAAALPPPQPEAPRAPAPAPRPASAPPPPREPAYDDGDDDARSSPPIPPAEYM